VALDHWQCCAESHGGAAQQQQQRQEDGNARTAMCRSAVATVSAGTDNRTGRLAVISPGWHAATWPASCMKAGTGRCSLPLLPSSKPAHAHDSAHFPKFADVRSCFTHDVAFHRPFSARAFGNLCLHTSAHLRPLSPPSPPSRIRRSVGLFNSVVAVFIGCSRPVRPFNRTSLGL
jgi:hypothetical protein